MDVLTDLLSRSRARGAGFSHTVVRGAAGVRFPPGPGLAVHVMVDGEAYLTVDGADGVDGVDGPDAPPVRLVAGDLVLVRGTERHRLATPADAPCRELVDLLAEGPVGGSSRAYAVGPAEGPTTAVFFCGAYLFDGDLFDGLLAALPDTVVLRPAAGGALRATADLLGREVLDDAPGQQALLDRLLDVALVQVLRQHFAEAGAAAPAWFRASADAGVGAALRALHADPAAPWTVASLAGEAALSRGAFARRFRDRLGLAPLEYLTDWRMALARERLRDSDDGLAAVGAAVGYRSEFAFAAAFKRHHGAPPGRWRTDARHATH